jgi:hypothetical protein
MTSKAAALLAFLVVAALVVAPAHAAKCTCEPPTEEAKAVGWWDDAPPNVVPKRDIVSG